MLTTRDLDAAREYLSREGGWLLDMGDGNYLATDNEGIARDLRGDDFVTACQAAQCWDETDERLIWPPVAA